MTVSIMYVCEQGAVVKKSGGRIQVVRGCDMLANFPIRTLNHLLLFGNVQLTTQATASLLEHGVDVSFLSMNGRLRGRLTGCYSKNIFVRLAQHERWLNQAYRLDMARNIVRGKTKNMLNMIKIYRRLRPELKITGVKETIVMGISRLENKKNTSEIMGAEGSLTAAYFYVFSQMFRGDIQFTGRRKRPSPDPANALLSLGYTLVTNELSSLLESLSMDPYLGFLHGIKYGRRALALDLVEEFRQPLVDRFTLRLLNQRMFRSEDFEVRDGGGLYLTDEALKKYLSYYEDNLRRKNQRGYCWRDLFRVQVNHFGKAVLAGSGYIPFETE